MSWIDTQQFVTTHGADAMKAFLINRRCPSCSQTIKIFTSGDRLSAHSVCTSCSFRWRDTLNNEHSFTFFKPLRGFRGDNPDENIDRHFRNPSN